MTLRGSEAGDGTRLAYNSPPRGGEQPARDGRARARRLRNLLAASAFTVLFLGSAFLGGMVQGIANPPHVYLPPTPQVASPAVSIQPGVTFFLPAAHVNITFANVVSASSNITLPGYGKSLTIDTYNLTFYKSPNTYPGISLNFTTWNPAQTTVGGAVAVASVVVPSGTTTLYLNLSGLAPNVFVFPLVDGSSKGGVITNAAGSASFSFWDWGKLSRTIELDVGNVQGGPSPQTILPSFAVTHFFDFFNASSDEWAQFRDTTNVNGSAPTSRMWKFGDGASSPVVSPMHHYNYSLSGSFNVTLLVCSGSVCNLVSQSVTLIRWHLLIWGAGITLLGGLTLLAVWTSGRISKRIGKTARAQVKGMKRRLARVRVTKIKRRLWR